MPITAPCSAAAPCGAKATGRELTVAEMRGIARQRRQRRCALLLMLPVVACCSLFSLCAIVERIQLGSAPLALPRLESAGVLRIRADAARLDLDELLLLSRWREGDMRKSGGARCASPAIGASSGVDGGACPR